ncbi:MAG TPA: DMT family transporter [Ktedonobacteraceae bacterium]|nr:DMT family transporter [Ktedonobacteraceae bacterium]
MLTEVEQTTRGTASPAQPALPSPRLRNEALLALNTVIWGGTFLVVKYEVKLSGPFTYLSICYAVGALTLALIFRRRLAHITRAELRGGLLLGLVLFAGYAFQTTGLQFTSVSKAGFITGLYVPLVPLFFFVFLRHRPAFTAIIGIALAFAGLFLLSINNQLTLSIGIGEVLIFGAAVAFAAHILLIGKLSHSVDMTNLAIIQLSLTSLLSLAVLPFARELHTMPPAQFWLIAVLMGMGDIAYTLLVMNRVQQRVGGIRATLIYSMEPLWAALAGVLLAGDVLSIPAWIGGGCILAGMIVGRLGQ